MLANWFRQWRLGLYGGLFVVTLGLILGLGLWPAISTPPIGTASSPASQDYRRGLSAVDFVALKENGWREEYASYFQRNIQGKTYTPQYIQRTLARIQRQNGSRAAVLHLFTHENEFALLVSTWASPPILITQPAVTQAEMNRVMNTFRRNVSDPRTQFTKAYLSSGQTLYDWWIKPLEAQLAKDQVDTLLFCVGPGLRSLPWAALFDGKKFLIERFNMSLIPGFDLTDVRYKSLKNSQVLAMGASEFLNFSPLPNVPAELKTIQDLWGGPALINQDFTVQNLRQERQRRGYPIVHLATHAMFQPGKVNNSFIQLWQENSVRLNQLPSLNLGRPPAELLVLSACQTALGDEQAELGFAGLALQAGVKSALGSLWQVSDQATFELMKAFYADLKNAPYKALALRHAQQKLQQNPEFQAPYYWAGFTMIGSPW
ncbi:CHAT domain-containing protein [Thermosynechococcaceae cyanobacterium BACA0444]|uniref:CHAT domain-containing protein n=1 Tax=Pseudocalidococcus azoricus BACA0444 TaxID=2918990 RepID=A0AAE4FS35_9CYAN|nr:CHAT domain-containing protein [Pseudocalidococcus azoricus]MDS3861110.1 CHAT domain-containing protein [Pseudocalidococcus azoricus BACA0444]